MRAMRASSPAPDIDWTALHNFAALRGQLRVSFTPRCNIACWFCHNEGDVPPPVTRLDRAQQPRPRQLDADAYLALIAALMNAGLKRVYFTGGEPLTSPVARPVVEGLPESGPDASYALITNGTRVRTHRSWLARRLGHTNAAMTLNIYTHLWPDSEERTRAAVDKAYADHPDEGDAPATEAA